MTAPNSTDDIDTIKLAVSQTMLHTSGVIKRWNNPSIHPKELNAELDAIFHEQVAAIQAEVQRQVVAELRKIPNFEVADEPGNAAQYINDRIKALQQGIKMQNKCTVCGNPIQATPVPENIQLTTTTCSGCYLKGKQGDNGSITLNGNTEYWSKETDAR